MVHHTQLLPNPPESPGRLNPRRCDLCKHHLVKAHKKIKQGYKTASGPQNQIKLVQLGLPHLSLVIKPLSLRMRNFRYVGKQILELTWGSRRAQPSEGCPLFSNCCLYGPKIKHLFTEGQATGVDHNHSWSCGDLTQQPKSSPSHPEGGFSSAPAQHPHLPHSPAPCRAGEGPEQLPGVNEQNIQREAGWLISISPVGEEL